MREAAGAAAVPGAAAAAARAAAATAAGGLGGHHHHWEARRGRQLAQRGRQAPPRLRAGRVRQVVHHDELRARLPGLPRSTAAAASMCMQIACCTLAMATRGSPSVRRRQHLVRPSRLPAWPPPPPPPPSNSCNTLSRHGWLTVAGCRQNEQRCAAQAEA